MVPMAFNYHPMPSTTTAPFINNVENINIQPYYVPPLPMIITDEDIKSNYDLIEYLTNRGDVYESTIGTNPLLHSLPHSLIRSFNRI